MITKGKEPTIRVGILHTEKEPAWRLNGDDTFTLYNVKIGIDFHWERCEEQTFRGELQFVNDAKGVWAVNVIPLEQYLTSVISSEMSANSPLEFLKAHAVIARSWALSAPKGHELFDVCADDHCQRYQGITRIVNENARQAVEDTRGQVLTYNGEICDTRYSKCCGGQTEVFSTCWEGEDKPYLQSVPCPHCNIQDDEILHQILNGFDQETTDFHEWKETYTSREISDIVSDRMQMDVGTIEDLIPIERGPSGRISKLKIVATNATFEIGKELSIRRVLSRSHLRSSNFEVVKSDDGFVLHGRGWGHGVGLCQIGAAVMGLKGFKYDEILKYYYRGTEIKRIYEY